MNSSQHGVFIVKKIDWLCTANGHKFKCLNQEIKCIPLYNAAQALNDIAFFSFFFFLLLHTVLRKHTRNAVYCRPSQTGAFRFCYLIFNQRLQTKKTNILNNDI